MNTADRHNFIRAEITFFAAMAVKPHGLAQQQHSYVSRPEAI
ncbi:MAG TPA: hypothetical protein VGS08_03405 [Candidatus Saccharimonadales bacterium]|nr:hypothetical protein [Candidatus Saccharimonadales bacterium]